MNSFLWMTLGNLVPELRRSRRCTGEGVGRRYSLAEMNWIVNIDDVLPIFVQHTPAHTFPRKREDWWATKRNCFCPSEDDHPRRRKIRWPFVHWQSSWLKRRDDVSYHLSWRAVYVCVRGGCFSVPKFYSWIPILMVHSFYSPSTSTSLAD